MHKEAMRHMPLAYVSGMIYMWEKTICVAQTSHVPIYMCVAQTSHVPDDAMMIKSCHKQMKHVTFEMSVL